MNEEQKAKMSKLNKLLHSAIEAAAQQQRLIDAHETCAAQARSGRQEAIELRDFLHGEIDALEKQCGIRLDEADMHNLSIALEAAESQRKHLDRTWPSDGWDGAADARAHHHKLVIDNELLIDRLKERLEKFK